MLILLFTVNVQLGGLYLSRSLPTVTLDILSDFVMLANKTLID